MADRSRQIPVVLVLPALLGLLLLLLPLVGVAVRTPWHSFGSIIADPATESALWLSLWTATCATVLSLLLGVPFAWLLARLEFFGKRFVRALVLLPLVLPPVVGGVALLMAFGRTGVVGRTAYDLLGISLPFTPAAVIIAQTFVAMPFLIVTVEGALRSMDIGLEDAAATLGARPLQVLRRITLPILRPAIIAGSVLCWARALGEFGATITFAGAFPGRTETMPIAVYYAMETDPQTALVLSVILLAVSLTVLIGLRERWLRGGASA